MTPSKDLAHRVRRGLAEIGLEVKVAKSGRDLGHDNSLGRYRSMATPQAREKASWARVKPIKAIAVVGGPANKLANTALLPKLAYHVPIGGAAPTTIQKHRSMKAEALGKKKPGYCLTTALALSERHPDDPLKSTDPAAATRRLQAKEWLIAWQRLGLSDRLAVGRAWGKITEDAVAKGDGRRWNAVRGPISAMVYTLFDIGWYPWKPAIWMDTKETTWIAADGPADLRPVLRAIAADALNVCWVKAAENHNGQGLEAGASVARLARSIAQIRGGSPEEAGALQATATNRAWTSERQREGGYDATSCLLCGTPDPSDEHRFWSCSCICELQTPAITESNHLAHRAKACLLVEACFWLRGVVPSPWLAPTQSRIVERKVQYNVQAATLAGDLPLSLPNLASRQAYL